MFLVFGGDDYANEGPGWKSYVGKSVDKAGADKLCEGLRWWEIVDVEQERVIEDSDSD